MLRHSQHDEGWESYCISREHANERFVISMSSCRNSPDAQTVQSGQNDSQVVAAGLSAASCLRQPRGQRAHPAEVVLRQPEIKSSSHKVQI
eukprot:5611886-Pleurochrysis_carterae.AAC.3